MAAASKGGRELGTSWSGCRIWNQRASGRATPRPYAAFCDVGLCGGELDVLRRKRRDDGRPTRWACAVVATGSRDVASGDLRGRLSKLAVREERRRRAVAASQKCVADACASSPATSRGRRPCARRSRGPFQMAARATRARAILERPEERRGDEPLVAPRRPRPARAGRARGRRRAAPRGG